MAHMTAAEKRMMQEAYAAIANALEKLAAFPHEKVTAAVRVADRAYTEVDQALTIVETFLNRHP